MKAELFVMLLPAIAAVESNNNPNAIGDNGNAVGLYQIWPAYWKDGCETLKVKWPLTERKDPQKSKEIVMAYLYKYGKRYEKLTKKPITLEVLARIHNGGPNGWKKESTLKYWEKIKRAIEQRKSKNH